jgi:hypothetical protein
MRRDRLLLISSFATALLAVLGAVGESLGTDRLLKSNTSKTRTHSLFRQGCLLYELIPNMPEHRLCNRRRPDTLRTGDGDRLPLRDQHHEPFAPRHSTYGTGSAASMASQPD